MIHVRITKGQVAWVDDVDADLATMKWCAIYNPTNGTYYARHREPNNPDGSLGKGKSMHQVIAARMGIVGMVDHRSRNGLDNRRGNLRAATASQNAMNRRRTTLNRSGFKGVGLDMETSTWRARLGIGNKRVHVGRFLSPVTAALAYDRAAVATFGPFARVNFVVDPIVHAAIAASARGT